MILGLDCALKTGFALLNRNGNLEKSGIWDFHPRYKKHGTGALYLDFQNSIILLIEKYLKKDEIFLIGIENVHHRGRVATRLGYGYLTMLNVICYLYHIDLDGIHSLTLKKFVTGSGKAEKSEMIKAAEQFKGSAVIDDNEADAIHVARFFYEKNIYLGIDKSNTESKTIISKIEKIY